MTGSGESYIGTALLNQFKLQSFFNGILYIISPLTKRAAAKEEVKLKVERVFNEYGNSILRLAYSYLHNIQDAEDILQSTIVSYIKAEKNFKTYEYEKAWLLRVAANLSKNKIKYNKVRAYIELDDAIPAPQSGELAFVWDAVKSLPENYSEVIHLYYYEGFSTMEIAGILKKNQATVRSLLKRGRDLLKIQLKEAYDFEV
ncbi:MAG: sigma-70 family RNA polymerase sigma factor [Clostridia bacterium]|nr:sigma-70 family RNA polymerase sigma factor [Clostridia bacterium]